MFGVFESHLKQGPKIHTEITEVMEAIENYCIILEHQYPRSRPMGNCIVLMRCYTFAPTKTESRALPRELYIKPEQKKCSPNCVLLKSHQQVTRSCCPSISDIHDSHNKEKKQKYITSENERRGDPWSQRRLKTADAILWMPQLFKS